jgi:hypothetical protein
VKTAVNPNPRRPSPTAALVLLTFIATLDVLPALFSADATVKVKGNDIAGAVAFKLTQCANIQSNALTIDHDCLSRIRDGTVVKNSYFKGCFRVHLKNRNSLIENTTFEYSIGPAVALGSDYGYWMESDFARNIAVRNNRFDHCGLAANFQSGVEDALGVIWAGLVTVPSSRGFKTTYENTLELEPPAPKSDSGPRG